MTEPRDLHCARCDARIELRHYDYPQYVRDHIPVAEAAAGPEPESPASAWIEGYRRGRIEAEAAAGSRDEGLDVERLAQAMREHIASIRKDNDDSPCVEHCARDIARRYEAAAGSRETFVGPGGKRIKVKFAEAAAGPRDEGLDVERLARAMQNVEDELTATSIAYEYAALAKASDHD